MTKSVSFKLSLKRTTKQKFKKKIFFFFFMSLLGETAGSVLCILGDYSRPQHGKG